MGGCGSGPRDNKPDTSESKRLDIRYMRKSRLLHPGVSGSLSWTCRGKPSGCIEYRITQDNCTLILDYQVSKSGGEWQPMAITVPLEARPCRYGGERQYFRCPNRHCSRRCEVLYSCGLNFVCRKCCRYLYPSQKGHRLDKLSDARHKLGARIFADWDGSEGWRKRKGMHWRTFERHHQTYRALEAA